MSIHVKPQISLDLAALHGKEKLPYPRKSPGERLLSRQGSVASSDWTRQAQSSPASNMTKLHSVSSSSNWNPVRQQSTDTSVNSFSRSRSAGLDNHQKQLVHSNRTLTQHKALSNKLRRPPSSVISLELKSRPSSSSSFRRRLSSKDIVHHLYEIWIPQLSDNYRPFAYFIPVPESYRSVSRCSEQSEKSVSEAKLRLRTAESVVEICNRIGGGGTTPKV